MPYRFNYIPPVGTGSHNSDPVLQALNTLIDERVRRQLSMLSITLAHVLPVLTDEEYALLPSINQRFWTSTSETPRAGVVHRPVPSMLFGNSNDMRREAARILNTEFGRAERDERNRAIADETNARDEARRNNPQALPQQEVVRDMIEGVALAATPNRRARYISGTAGGTDPNTVAAPPRAIMTDTEPEDQ